MSKSNPTVSPITAIVKNKIVSSNNKTGNNVNKRLLSSSSSSPPQSPPIVTSKITKLFFTPNRFAPLSVDDTDSVADNNVEIDDKSETINQGQQNTTNVAPKIILPPPIFIKGVHDYIGLRDHLKEVTSPDSFMCKSTGTHLKIQADTPNSYKNIIHYLKETNAQYHTYQPQFEKPLRVVIRNLHPSTPEADIASAIQEIGHTVRNVSNVRYQQTKTPLPIFFVDIDPNDSDSDIFSITSLLHTKIKIEEPYKKRQIPQCQNCQSYGHNRTYCAHNPMCVKCGGKHLSTTCQKSPDLPAKCALCEGAHPANYKGCTIYKQLSRKQNNISNKSSQQPPPPNFSRNPELHLQYSTNGNPTTPRSYANNELQTDLPHENRSNVNHVKENSNELNSNLQQPTKSNKKLPAPMVDDDLLEFLVRVADNPAEWNKIRRVLSMLGRDESGTATASAAAVVQSASSTSTPVPPTAPPPPQPVTTPTPAAPPKMAATVAADAVGYEHQPPPPPPPPPTASSSSWPSGDWIMKAVQDIKAAARARGIGAGGEDYDGDDDGNDYDYDDQTDDEIEQIEEPTAAPPPPPPRQPLLRTVSGHMSRYEFKRLDGRPDDGRVNGTYVAVIESDRPPRVVIYDPARQKKPRTDK